MKSRTTVEMITLLSVFFVISFLVFAPAAQAATGTAMVRLIDSNGNGISGATAQYATYTTSCGTSWNNLGSVTNATGYAWASIATNNYCFRVNYASTISAVQGPIAIAISGNLPVTFQTTLVTVQIEDHTGALITSPAATSVQYEPGATWYTFGSGSTSGGQVSKELLPATYNFRLTYASLTSAQSSVIVTATSPFYVTFQTTLVTVQLEDHTGALITSPAATGVQYQFGTSSWANIGSGSTSGGQASMELLPATYNFRLTYAYATQTKSSITVTAPNTSPFYVTFQTTLVTVQLEDHNGDLITSPAATNLQYAPSSTYYMFDSGATSGGQASMELLPATYSFKLTYASVTATQSSVIVTATSPFYVNFQTTLVTVQLQDHTGALITSPAATNLQYAPSTGTYYMFDSGATSGGQASMELLPATYSFKLTYALATQTKSSIPVTAPNTSPFYVNFQTTLVTVQLLNSAGNLITDTPGTNLQYINGGSYTMFDSGSTSGGQASMELLPASNYYFKLTYLQTTMTKSSITVPATSPFYVNFQTTLVTIQFRDSTGALIATPSPVRYNVGSSGYIFGSGNTTDGAASMELLAGTYSFMIQYAHASKSTASLSVSGSTYAVNFQTTLVVLRLNDCTGALMTNSSADASYIVGGSWYTFGSGSTDAVGTVSMELLPAQYSFSLSLFQTSSTTSTLTVPATSPYYVDFQTSYVTMRLIDSAGNPISGAKTQYSHSAIVNAQLFDFGVTGANGATGMQLFSGPLDFLMTYANTVIIKWNVQVPKSCSFTVTYQTTKVVLELRDSDGNLITDGSATAGYNYGGPGCYGGGIWYNFDTATSGGTISMELLSDTNPYQFNMTYNGQTIVSPNMIVPATSPFVYAFHLTKVSVASNPSGEGFVTVDGSPITTPQTFYWVQGAQHTLAATSLVSGPESTQYVFQAWSDGGDQSHTVTGPASPTTYTANFKTQYLLTMQAGTGGSASPASGWQDSGAVVSISATANPNYEFSSWAGTGDGSYSGTDNPASVTMNAPVSETAVFQLSVVSITITSNPAGAGFVTVDGSPIETPQTFSWVIGSSHTLAAASEISGSEGQRYVFQAWSDNGDPTHAITTPDTSTTYTATFKTQYMLTMQASIGGSASPASGWQDSGAAVSISATAATNYEFSSWAGSGTGSYSGTDNPASITMNGPIAETAVFQLSVVPITIASNPAGSGIVTVDGSPITTPQTFSWIIGSSHTLAASSKVAGTEGVQYVFQSWSNGGDQSQTYTVPGSGETVTADYKTQYQLILQSGNGGSVSPASGWQDSGTVISISATPSDGYEFTSWTGSGTGSYSGTDSQASITMNGPVGETASFQPAIVVVTVTSDPAGSGFVSVDDSPITTPQTFNWTFGSSHVITANSLVSGDTGTQYVFLSWSDSGTLSHSVTAPSSPVTYTASFKTQYQLTMQAGTGGSVSPSSGWHDAGVAVSIAAAADEHYLFVSWAGTGDGSYTGDANPANITMSGPVAETATFQHAPVSIIVASNPAGSGFVTVDDIAITTPQTFNWTFGSTHVIAAASEVSGGEGVRYVFQSWSDTGQQSHSYTVPDDSATITASYSTQYILAVQAGTGGTASPVSGWQDSGAVVSISASPGTGYEFASWAGTGSGSYSGTDNPASITMSGPVTEAATFQPATVSITVTSDPSGSGFVTVDDAVITTPQTFNWTFGSSHVIAANSPVGGSEGVQYVFQSWSDSGDQSHSITAPSSPTTYTATFKTQYMLTMQTGTGGSVSPESGWQNSDATVSISAAADTNYEFASWTGSGDGSYSGTDNPASVTMNGPITETASFRLAIVSITVASDPAGSGFVTVDDSPITTPQTYSWTIGSSHLIAAASEVSGGEGVRYVFQSWSDSGDQSHSFIVPSNSTTVTASYVTQYMLTMQAGTGGSVSPSSGWQDSGAVVDIQATPDTGYEFESWTGSGSGSYTGTDTTASITMNNPMTETASFKYTIVSVTVTSDPSGDGYVTVDSTPITTPQDFNWTIGSSHVIAANSPVGGSEGVQYVFQSWSDSGDQSHSITAPSSPTTYTATFKTQYMLTMQATNDGQVSPISGWQDSGAVISISASPGTGYKFASWAGSGDGSYSGTDNPASATMNGPITEMAEFGIVAPSQVAITVSSNPFGDGFVTVDSAPITTPQTFNWTIGSSHVIAASSQVSGSEGTRYIFQSWSDSGDQAHTYTVPSDSATITATYSTQYMLTMQAGTGGSVSPESGWQESGAVVSISATPDSSHLFDSWTGTGSGSYSGTDNPANVTMSEPATETASFLVKDTTPPVIVPSVDPAANANGWNNAPVTVSWTVSDPESDIASSNCTDITLTSETTQDGTVIACTATNGAGLSSSGSVTVRIDLTPPVLTTPDVTAEATGPSGATVSYTASAIDELSGLDTFSCSPPSGSIFHLGESAVSCTAADNAGNPASGLFNVTIQDTTPPAVNVPDDMTVEATGPSGATVTFTATASDIVDGALTPSCAPPSGSAFALGTTRVTCSATDSAANAGSASFNVSVVDRTPPTLSLPADMTVQATDQTGAVVSFTATASDLVDGSVPVTCTPASGTKFLIGTTTVSCSSTDAASNTASGSFKVTVTTAPPAVTVKLLNSNGGGISGGVVQYYSGGWKPFGTTGSDGSVSMGLASGTYTFQMSYGGASLQKNQNTATNSTVKFQTVSVSMKLLSSTSAVLSGGAQYYASGWKTFGTGTTTTTMELLPLTYTFQISYGGASLQKNQDTSTNPNVVFQTVLTNMKLLSSTSAVLSGGAQYYASGWKTFGAGTTTTTMELLPVTYTFQISYGGASLQKNQDTSTNPNVVFQTVSVSMKLLSSTSAVLSGGAQYYASGWKTFGTGTTTTTMEMLPLTYTFQISNGGASLQKNQDVSSNANVVFQTTSVSMSLLSSTNAPLSGSGQYYASGWKTFGTGTTSTTMELLPVTYTFQISYGGASQQKNQDVSANPSVVFQTALVSMSLVSSTNAPLSGTGQYYASGWKTFGTGTTTTTMELLPVTYTFQISYGGASLQKNQDVSSNPSVVFQTASVSMSLISSASAPLSGSGQYYASGWKVFGAGTTPTTMELLPVTYTFQISYGGASLQKNQDVSSNPSVVFQTVQVSMSLVSSANGPLNGAGQYYASGWKVFSSGTTPATMELLPVTYTFQISYGGASLQKNQDVSANPSVVFQTVSVSMSLVSSASAQLNGAGQYYASGWKTFGTGTTPATMEMLPVTYTFQISYGGASLQKNQDVSSNPNVVFSTVQTSMKLLSSTGSLLSGTGQYYASGWKTFGAGTTPTTMELLPVTYTFQISYGGASLQKNQNVATDPNVVFNTVQVSMSLISSASAPLSGAGQYYASGWKTFGTGTTPTTMELLPVTYTFQISYGGASLQKNQDVSANPNVSFQTVLASTKLLSSTGTELNGGAQYYASGWKVFGSGTTTTTMELLPVTYTFQISYGGASQQKNQNIATDPNVIFNTVQVHSDSGTCVTYYAGGWKTFTQDMEMLPVAYTFHFNGSADAQFTIVAGTVNHIR